MSLKFFSKGQRVWVRMWLQSPNATAWGTLIWVPGVYSDCRLTDCARPHGVQWIDEYKCVRDTDILSEDEYAAMMLAQ